MNNTIRNKTKYIAGAVIAALLGTAPNTTQAGTFGNVVAGIIGVATVATVAAIVTDDTPPPAPHYAPPPPPPAPHYAPPPPPPAPHYAHPAPVQHFAPQPPAPRNPKHMVPAPKPAHKVPAAKKAPAHHKKNAPAKRR